MTLQIPEPQDQSTAPTPVAILVALVALAILGLLLYAFGLGILAVFFIVILFLDDIVPIWQRRFHPLPLNILR